MSPGLARRPDDVVHLWVARPPAGGVEVLSADERHRAARMTHRRAAHEYVACRAWLRTVVGEHLGRPPADLRIATGAHGKPFLSDAAVRFSVSHSHGVAAIAVSADEVGVDVEPVGRLTWGPAARRVLRPGRVHAASTPEEVTAAWTVVEADGKAAGRGLPGGPVGVSGPRAGWRGRWRVRGRGRRVVTVLDDVAGFTVAVAHPDAAAIDLHRVAT